MTISGISSSNPAAFGQPVARPQAQPAGDQVSMSLSAEKFSSFVEEAGQHPEVRGELVGAFKARVDSGEYPSPETLDGLADVLSSPSGLFSGPSGSSQSVS